MALTTTELRQTILDEFNNSSVQSDGSILNGYGTINDYADTVSNNIGDAVQEYLEAVEDADGDAVISPIIVSALKSALRAALIYNPNDPENVDISRVDLAFQNYLLTALIGIQFGLTTLPPGWLTKLSSTSTIANGSIIFFRRDVSDFFSVTNEDLAAVLADQIMGIVETTQVLTVGTLPGSPPTPTTRVAAVI